MTVPVIATEGFSLTYDGKTSVVENMSFTVAKGEFVALLGPSGCGKTSLLKYLAGLRKSDEVQTRGGATVNGRDPMDGEQLRGGRMGFVFESPSLLPWRTVLENAMTGLHVAGNVGPQQRERVIDLLLRTGLEDYLDYYPKQISLGMQQRTALVRCLAYEPSIVFMDTPFSGIDSQTKLAVFELVSYMLLGDVTVFLVTHDVSEATLLADRVLILSPSPASVRTSIEISLERPRDIVALRKSERFALLEGEIWAATLEMDADA